MMRALLLTALGTLTAAYSWMWAHSALSTRKNAGTDASGGSARSSTHVLIGFGTNFLDTLGIGSFATTTSLYKIFSLVPDHLVPGTLNAGHALPTAAEALIFITLVTIGGWTLTMMIAAAVAGAWLGAGIVSAWPRRYVQAGMGTALLAAAGLMLLTQFELLPAGGTATSLEGAHLVIAMGGNFVLGALMTLGIGLYAPCMILISILGMDPRAAYPIMMGSCAFLMPFGSVRFIRQGRYSLPAAVGLTLGGIPGVLLAALVVRSLPLDAVRWLVVVIVVYTAAALLRSARIERGRPPISAAEAATRRA